jgi:UDP:flavonoid glycosyltransferase YjiC (YdhE family)
VSRFLITLWPFTGHLLPQVAIARALRERGHEVAFYSGEAVRHHVEGQGFTFYPFQRVDQEIAFSTMRTVDTGDGRSRPGGGRLMPLMRDWLVETIPDQIADVREVIDSWQPAAIATDLSLWGSVAVLPELGAPPIALSSTFMGPLIPGPDAPAFGFGLRPPRGPAGRVVHRGLTELLELAGTPIRKRLDEVRAGLGLGPLGESVNRHTARLPLYIVGNVRELDYGRHDLPPSVHYVGNCIWYPDSDETDGESTESWLERVPTGRPWVHVCESTLAFGDPFLLRTAVQALANQPVEVILTVGQRDPRAPGFDVSAPNVHVARWLHHGALIPRCSVLVTVGGKATVLAAAQAGVPMVVVPTSWDKPDNARRVTEAGVGVRVPARACNPANLRSAVRAVLYRHRYRTAAARLAQRLAQAPGPARAAELLEELAATGAASTPAPLSTGASTPAPLSTGASTPAPLSTGA